MTQKKIKIIDLGMVDYNDGISYQKKIHNNSSDNANVILLEHDKVITIGTKGDKNDVLVSANQLKKEGFSVINSDRGGQVTIHNKGQLVCYIVMPISNYNLKPVDFVRKIESLIINVLKNFDVSSYIIKGKTGVWVKSDNIEKKIAAIGVRISNGISMHGFALNINNNLNDFDFIVPCGIQGSFVTSIQEELKKKVKVNDLKIILQKELENNFDCEVIYD